MNSQLKAPDGLPSNVYAERMVLGALISEGERFIEFRDSLAAGDFSLDKHQRIWQRMKDLSEAGTPIDYVTTMTRLQACGELEAVDGVSYLASLADGLPHIYALDAYVQIVRETAKKRQMIFWAQGVMQAACTSTESSTKLLESAREQLTHLGEGVVDDAEFLTPMEVITRAGGPDEYFRTAQKLCVPFPAEWAELQATTGGIMQDDVVVVAAPPGGGKTAFALSIARGIAMQGYGTALLSLEMKAKRQVNRLIALQGRFNSYWFKVAADSWTPNQRATVYDATTAVADLPIFIRDIPTISVASLISAVHRLKARSKVEIRLVVVDYLQLIQGPGSNETERIAKIMMAIKSASMELGIPFLVLSQFGREVLKEGGKPKMQNLLGSQYIEATASIILFLYGQSGYEVKPNEWMDIELLVAKQRDGAANFGIEYVWRKDCGVFEERNAPGQRRAS